MYATICAAVLLPCPRCVHVPRQPPRERLRGTRWWERSLGRRHARRAEASRGKGDRERQQGDPTEDEEPDGEVSGGAHEHGEGRDRTEAC